MAKFAFGKRPPEDREAASVSRHPAFPAIVALWFAALLGLGSLLLPPILFERFVPVSGLAAFMPAAAPPFGFKIRLLIGFGCAIFGALLGYSVARRVMSAHPSPSEPRLMQQAPVDIQDESELSGEATIEREELELDCVIETVAGPTIDWRASDQPYEAPEMTETHESWPDPDLGNWQFPAEPAPDDGARLEEILEPVGKMEAELATEPLVGKQDIPLPKLIEQLALAIRKRRDWLDAAQFSVPAEPSRAATATLEAAPAGEAVQAMAAWFETSALPEPLSDPEPASEPPALQRPAFLDWLDDVGQEEDESPLPPFSLPSLAPLSVAELAPFAEDGGLESESDETVADEDAYGSLIGMKNPFAPPRSDYICIVEGEKDPEREPDPAGWTEGEQEQSDRIETEAALRSALAGLQRISGAA